MIACVASRFASLCCFTRPFFVILDAFQTLCDLKHPRHAAPEEDPIGFAEIVGVKALGLKVPLALAAAPAKFIKLTIGALRIQLIGTLHKSADLVRSVNGIEPVGVEVAQLPRFQHVEVTRINAAIRLDHALGGTAAILLAGFGLIAQQDGDVVFKAADVGLLSLLPILIPQIEQA